MYDELIVVMTDQHPFEGTAPVNKALHLVPMPPITLGGGTVDWGYAFALCRSYRNGLKQLPLNIAAPLIFGKPANIISPVFSFSEMTWTSPLSGSYCGSLTATIQSLVSAETLNARPPKYINFSSSCRIISKVLSSSSNLQFRINSGLLALAACAPNITKSIAVRFFTVFSDLVRGNKSHA